jgi:glycosyltransferase involved in cell wall biosynthesis
MWWDNLYLNRKNVLNNLKQTNYAIALSSHQVPIIQEVLGIKDVKFLPHGVYTNIFLPNNAILRERSKILIVGSWFRDFQLLKKIILECNKKFKHIEFCIVAEKKFSKDFNSFNNVKFLSGISNDILINLYQTCTLLLLPLIDSVANNALLEAMSCGTPILVSNVGGVKDYTNNNCVDYLSCDISVVIQQIEKIIDDNIYRNNLSLNARRNSLNFDWSKIRKDLNDVYISLI